MQGIFFSEIRRFAGLALGLPEAEIEAAGGTAEHRPLERYPEADFFGLVGRLSGRAGLSQDELLRRFGQYLFGRLVALFPVFFEGVGSVLDLLGDFERLVHDEVRRADERLDPPRLECLRPTPDRVEIVYRSRRDLADLAEGLILGCAAHFEEGVVVSRVPGTEPGAVRFAIRYAAGAPRRA